MLQMLTGASGVTIAGYFVIRVLRFLASLTDLMEKGTKIGKRLDELMDAQLKHLKAEEHHRQQMEQYFDRLRTGVPVHLTSDHTPIHAIHVPPHAAHSESSR